MCHVKPESVLKLVFIYVEFYLKLKQIDNENYIGIAPISQQNIRYKLNIQTYKNVDWI